MDNMTLKRIIAQNIADLRRDAGMTQLELAARLNYSDKAVSKWERGESVPDILVLKSIADLYGVTVDYLIAEEHPVPGEAEDVPPVTHELPAVGQPGDNPAPIRARRPISEETVRSITLMAILSVWVIATATFVMLDLFLGHAWPHTLPFWCALPASMIIWLILTCVFCGGKHKYLIISLLMWFTLAAVHMSLWCFGHNIRQVYLIGIPGQAVIFLCRALDKGIRKNRVG